MLLPNWKCSRRCLCSHSREMKTLLTLLPRQRSAKLQISSLQHLLEMKILHFQFPDRHNCRKLQSSVSEESSHVEPDVPRPPHPHVFLPSYNSTPRITPPDSPPRSFTTISPPRRHSISVTSRNMFDDRSSAYSGHHSSMTFPFDAASHTGRTRVDGKEFFCQVRYMFEDEHDFRKYLYL